MLLPAPTPQTETEVNGTSWSTNIQLAFIGSSWSSRLRHSARTWAWNPIGPSQIVVGAGELFWPGVWVRCLRTDSETGLTFLKLTKLALL